jgi:predicted PurR-regulated permease PerM
LRYPQDARVSPFVNLELSPRQKRLVTGAISVIAAAVIVTAVVIFTMFVVRFFKNFGHVFLPFAVAGVLAMVLEPWFSWLQSRLKLPSGLAMVAVFASILLPVSLVLLFFGALLAGQLGDLLENIPEIWERFSGWLQHHRPRVEGFFQYTAIGQAISESVKSPGGIAARVMDYLASGAVSAGSGVARGVMLLLGWAILPVYLAFFLMIPKLRPESLTADNLPYLKPDTAEDVIYLVREFFNLVVVFFRGQLLVALIQGILFAIGFSLAGLQYGALLGLVLGFLNIIPYLGSMLGLAVCLPLAWFQLDGGLTLLVLVVVVFTVVQLIEGYLLTPRIMGDRTGLHPLVIIIAILFWGSALDGLLGMILAIPLTAFLVVAWKLARRKYIGALF